MHSETLSYARSLIKKHEGFRSRVYTCPGGKLTIGYGRNIEDLGLYPPEADYLLENDIKRFYKELESVFPNLKKLSPERQSALIDMIFNLGKTKFLQFKKFIQYISQERFDLAAIEMLDSKWAKDVGVRALELSDIIKKDKIVQALLI